MFCTDLADFTVVPAEFVVLPAELVPLAANDIWQASFFFCSRPVPVTVFPFPGGDEDESFFVPAELVVVVPNTEPSDL